MIDYKVIKANANHQLFIDDLQTKNAEFLSFYPTQTIKREIDNGRIYIGILNNQPCGYLYCGSMSGENLKIHQAVISYDARLREYGKSLYLNVESDAIQAQCSLITLRCGFDLEANHFWQSLGFQCVSHKNGGIRRNRIINIYMKQIGSLLFDLETTQPKYGKTDASIWRKNKKLGIVSGGFVRGKQLDRYRDLVLMGDKNKTGEGD